jgi:hypothetical protein
MMEETGTVTSRFPLKTKDSITLLIGGLAYNQGLHSNNLYENSNRIIEIMEEHSWAHGLNLKTFIKPVLDKIF